MTMMETALTSASQPHRITLTGSAGAIGRTVGAALRKRGHFVRGFDFQDSADLSESMIGNLVNVAAVARCVADVDTVIHLAATPDVHDFVTHLVPNNIIGTYYLLEQCLAAGVKRVLLASTFRVVAGGMQDGVVATAATPTAPRDYYALSKVCVEQMGKMAAGRGLQVIAARLGWLPRTTREAQTMAQTRPHRALYLSHHDCRDFFIRVVEGAWPVQTSEAFAIVYVFSGDSECPYDPSPAQTLLGYRGTDVFPHGLDFPFTPGADRAV